MTDPVAVAPDPSVLLHHTVQTTTQGVQVVVLEDVCPEQVLSLWMGYYVSCRASGVDRPSSPLTPTWRKRLAGIAR